MSFFSIFIFTVIVLKMFHLLKVKKQLLNILNTYNPKFCLILGLYIYVFKFNCVFYITFNDLGNYI